MGAFSAVESCARQPNSRPFRETARHPRHTPRRAACMPLRKPKTVKLCPALKASVRAFDLQLAESFVSSSSTTPIRANSGSNELVTDELSQSNRTGQIGYDDYGNEVDTDGLSGPRNPSTTSVYVNDKYEAGDVVLSAGVRVDMFNMDDYKLNDKETPVLFTLLKIAKLPNTKALVPIGFIGAKIFVVTPLMLV